MPSDMLLASPEEHSSEAAINSLLRHQFPRYTLRARLSMTTFSDT